jgi:hypothetical protein
MIGDRHPAEHADLKGCQRERIGRYRVRHASRAASRFMDIELGGRGAGPTTPPLLTSPVSGINDRLQLAH